MPVIPALVLMLLGAEPVLPDGCQARSGFPMKIRDAVKPLEGFSGIEVHLGTSGCGPTGCVLWKSKAEFEAVLGRPVSGFMETSKFSAEPCRTEEDIARDVKQAKGMALESSEWATDVALRALLKANAGLWCARRSFTDPSAAGKFWEELRLTLTAERSFTGTFSWSRTAGAPAGGPGYESRLVFVPQRITPGGPVRRATLAVVDDRGRTNTWWLEAPERGLLRISGHRGDFNLETKCR